MKNIFAYLALMSCFTISHQTISASNNISSDLICKTLPSLTSSYTDMPDLNTIWVTMSEDVAEHIQRQQPSLTPHGFHSISSTTGLRAKSITTPSEALAVLQIPINQIETLREIMYEEFHRHGGFFYHDSQEAAVAYAKEVQTAAPQRLLAANYTINNPTGVSALLNEVVASQLSATVKHLTDHNHRDDSQSSGVSTACRIHNHWQTISRNRSDINVELFKHKRWARSSVMATITGATNPEEIVVLGSHLGSKKSSRRETGRTPVADDNTSGIAVITEALRAMVAAGYRPARTVILFGYAAEKADLRGSQEIAQTFVNENRTVVGVAQFDITNITEAHNRDIAFTTDYTNTQHNGFMQDLIDHYLDDLTWVTSQCGYGCSDHASWHNEGFPVSFLLEFNIYGSNNRIHTKQDRVFNADHAAKFARLAVTYIAELAKSESNPPTPPPNMEDIDRNGWGRFTQDLVAGYFSDFLE